MISVYKKYQYQGTTSANFYLAALLQRGAIDFQVVAMHPSAAFAQLTGWHVRDKKNFAF